VASVTVILPPFLDVLPERLASAVATGMNVGGQEVMARIKTSPDFPRDTGGLIGGTNWIEAVPGPVITGAIVSGGKAAEYAEVQDRGRHPGKRGPPPQIVATKIVTWVRKQRAADVEAIARHLQSQYAAAHPKRRKGVSRALPKFREQAMFLLVRQLLRKLKNVGMPGKRFVSRFTDGPNGGEAGRVIRQRIGEYIGVEIARARGGA